MLVTEAFTTLNPDPVSSVTTVPDNTGGLFKSYTPMPVESVIIIPALDETFFVFL